MKYIELTITTTTEAQEIIADKMWEYTTYGVAICDVNDVLELIDKRRNTFDYIEEGLLDATDKHVLVKAYIDMDGAEEVISNIEKELEEIKSNAQGFIATGSLETIKRIVDGDDWIEVWRKHFRPIDLGRVVVCPEWIDYTEKQGQVVVKIDSNLAFGTGEHETTSMCIEMLGDFVNENATVIDVGTGSGILGISAIKLGAKFAYMTDIDSVAVSTAKHNAVLNGVGDKCIVDLNNLLDDKDVVGDIIVANITADVLAILAKGIRSNLKDNGRVILSGILKSKESLVLDTYFGLGFKLDVRKEKGEWVALSMVL